MIKKDSCWLLPCISLLVLGCTTRNRKETYPTSEIIYRVDTSRDIGENVDSIRYLPLLESDRHLISEATKIRIKDNRIVIFEKKTHRIVTYDTNGHFLYEINQRGKGNNEYMEIANMTVTDSRLYLMDNYKHKIHIYSIRDGSFIKSTDVPFIAWDLEAFDDNNFLFTMLENNPDGKMEADGNNYAVWRTDSLWNTTATYLPYEKGYHEMTGKEVYFTMTDANIIFHSFMKDGYYTFDSKGIARYTDVAFSNPIPHNASADYNTVSEKKYQYLSTTPYVTSDYVLTEIGQGNISEIYLYDSKTKTFLRNSEKSCVNAMVDIAGTWGKQFVSFVSDAEIYQDLISCGFKRADKTTESCLKNGGQCLVIYGMR